MESLRPHYRIPSSSHVGFLAPGVSVGMSLNFIPLVVAILPAVAVHLCYVVAAYLGHVPWCFPYIDSCTSISAAGRGSPEIHIFRATIIPTAIFMMMYWKLVYEWFRTLGSPTMRCNRAMLCFGITACFGLILYATVLGSIGPEYHLQRRIGVTVFYVLTFLAQLLMTGQMVSCARSAPELISARVWRSSLAVVAAVFMLGVTSFLLSAFYQAYHSIDDAFEWVLTLLILLHFLVTYFAWRDSKFRAGFAVSK